MFGALVVDEDDDRVDVHVVQPLDGMGGDVQEAVPVLRGRGRRMSAGTGTGVAGPHKHCSPSEDTSSLSLPPLTHTALPYCIK